MIVPEGFAAMPLLFSKMGAQHSFFERVLLPQGSLLPRRNIRQHPNQPQRLIMVTTRCTVCVSSPAS